MRAEVARRQSVAEIPVKVETVVSDAIRDYRFNNSDEVLETSYALSENEQQSIVLDLSPEPHDSKMAELVGMLQTHGVKNVLSVLYKMRNPHLEDDFHRFLVQYVKAGYQTSDIKKNSPLFRPLRTTLFEISLPDAEDKEPAESLKQLLSGMESFYAGMRAVGEGDTYFTLEIANANGSDEFVFYASVPDGKRNLFEKQLLSVLPKAKLTEAKDDYNIFNEAGVSIGSEATLVKRPAYTLKTYDEFEFDPLKVLLGSFSKIDKEGEGAALQIIISPLNGERYGSAFSEALKNLEKGKNTDEALNVAVSFWGEIGKTFKELLKADKNPKQEEKEKIRDESAIESVKKKISSPIFSCNIRLVASARSEDEAEEIIADLESAFHQFGKTEGNSLKFERRKGKNLRDFSRTFSFRTFDSKKSLALNAAELTALYHFPETFSYSSPQLKQAKAGASAAPLEAPENGTLLGVNDFHGKSKEIRILPEDRLRHFYVIGQTGTGKTTLLKNMIIQDIAEGEGVCMIDPHGADIQDVLASIPANRTEDVIYFDPSHLDRPMALNMLEYDRRFPEQKTFVVNEMLSIFDKLFDMKTAGGPMFEQYFRNAVMLTIEDPDTGGTLFDVSRTLANKAYRDLKLSRCKNPIVTQFWREVAEKAGGEASLQNIVPYITSKFDNFLSNDIMRPIVAQELSSFNMREIMDSRKILLVNLAKGRLGDINSNLLGLVLVGKILMAALSRVDSFGKSDLPPFYLYIDEFQNVTTPSIATILSEARKYKLSLNIAHQFIAQLDEKIKDAVFGNVGSMAVFRVGSEDAEFLEKQFEPVFSGKDIINLDNRNAYIKMLINGRPAKPFNIETLPPHQGDRQRIEKLKELSYLTYGRDRGNVEEEIMSKYYK